jgi:hypothetical protein
MGVNIIYFFVALPYGAWFLSLLTENKILAIFSSLLMFSLSIFIFINGWDLFPSSILICKMFAAVTFIIAVYTSFSASYALYENM